MTKKEMPIDKLLEWAYCRELLKNPSLLPRGAGEEIYGASAWGSIMKFGKFGCFIDGGIDSKWEPYSEGPPHLDAVRIDAAVQSLGNWSVEWPSSKEYLMDDIASITPDEDWLLQYRADLINVAVLITTAAMLKRAPDWGDDKPLPTRIISGRNNVSVVPPKLKGERLYKNGAYCPIQWEPKPESIAQHRVNYAAWYGALIYLADELKLLLTDFIPLSPTYPELPWEGQKRAEGRILPCLSSISKKIESGAYAAA